MSNRAKKLEEELQLRLLEVKDDPTFKGGRPGHNRLLADMLISDGEGWPPVEVPCNGKVRAH